MTPHPNDLTPRWYLATTPADPDNPLLSRDCELLMPPAMVAGFQALGWRVVEIEREKELHKLERMHDDRI